MIKKNLKNLMHIFSYFSGKKLEQKSSQNILKNKKYYLQCTMDRSFGPQSQGTVHENSYAVYRCGSQQEKDSGRDPTAEIQSDPDPTVQTHYRL